MNSIHKSIYSSLNKSELKQLKRLLRSTTGENFSIAQKTDPVYLCYSDKKLLIGYAMISEYSPDNHFKNTGLYLYNFVTDINLSKEKRCGKLLLKYIEDDLHDTINLDVEHTNLRAFKFFISNGYRVVGKYDKLDINNMSLSEIDANDYNKKITFISLSKVYS